MSVRCEKSGRFKKQREKSQQPTQSQATKKKQKTVEELHVDFVFEGRRIVEINFLGQQLKKCKHCDATPLFLHNIVREKRNGLGSTFSIKCDLCNKISSVCTGKKHEIPACAKNPEKQQQRKGTTFDINTKYALGE